MGEGVGEGEGEKEEGINVKKGWGETDKYERGSSDLYRDFFARGEMMGGAIHFPHIHIIMYIYILLKWKKSRGGGGSKSGGYLAPPPLYKTLGRK